MIADAPAENTAADILRARLQTCADEPIRIPGSIQRHGFLLLLDDSGQRVLAASENAENFLQTPLSLILGTAVDTVLEREMLAALLPVANLAPMFTYLGAFQVRGRLFSVTTHRVAEERIVEFELVDRLVSPELANQVSTNFVAKLSRLGDESELLRALALQVKDLTGFNRVLVYSFDAAGHGTVVAEENDGTLPSYLDLRFPASDIPPQARELYLVNTVRIIPDATYIPSPLRAVGSREVQTLDLSTSVLRSVSPIHLEYMRNMGTLSSMSISMVLDGKLWGLISAHHAEPRNVPFLVRSACDLLTKLACNQIMSLRTSASLKKMVHFHAVHRRMLTQMAAEGNYLDAMSGRMDDLIQITGSEGVALVVDGDCTSFGRTPQPADLVRLAQWMDAQPDLEIFHTSHLAEQIAWASDFVAVASGLLAIRISYARPSYVMWFRPEVVRTVTWAGEPVHAASQAAAQASLTPRKSFDSWKQLVRGMSDSWTEMEIESAADFRAAAMTIGLKRAEEAVQLGEARFLQLTHALPNPVWTADDDGRLTYVNRKWLDQGLSPDGRWFDQPRIAPEDRNRSADAWNAAVRDGALLELEVRFRSLEGQPGNEGQPGKNAERWNLVRAVPYLRASGVRAGWVGTCTDITDRLERETALRMTEKLALTGRMTSVIAHEINNPLEAITNLLFLLADAVKHDDNARSYIGLAESELRRISGITRQTLRWAREGVEKPEYGSARALFSDVLQLYAGQIRNRQVHVETPIVAGAPDIRLFGVLSQLTQVLSNLLSNAIQAVPVGGRISLNVSSTGNMIEIAVRDNGIGMSEEVLRNLFQPFYSTKGDLGNGLGLYISREIVENHGGTIAVEGKPGSGTEVRVRLPASPAQTEPT